MRKTNRVGFATLLVAFLGIHFLQAGSATWMLNPASSDWNIPTNWTPATVPNGPNDTATFDVSNTSNVLVGLETEVDGIVFNAGASPFTITVSSNDSFAKSLTISGVGIINNSGVTQNFVTTSVPVGHIDFKSSATAGNNTTFTNLGGSAGGTAVNFNDNSTAGSATIIVNGGTASHIQPSFLDFLDNATAANGTFLCYGGSAIGGTIVISGRSTAANGTFLAYGGMDVDHNGGTIELGSEATGGDGVFTLEGSDFAGANGAQMLISSTSTAGNATLIVDGGKVAGGNLFFQNNATGGTARVEVFSNGRLDISGHELPGITIGSIEGDGLILVGANQLMTGNNNVSTTFSGLLQDGGFYGGSGGALAKIGNGKLTLSGANTYTGGTIVNAGTLFVTNGRGSGTGRGAVQINAGKLGGTGKIAGNVVVGDGAAPEAYLTPGVTNGIPAILTLQKKVTFRADGTYHFGYKSSNLTADYLIVKGVTIGSGAELFFGPIDSGTLPIGTVFTVFDNRAATPIAGTFSNIADGGTVTVGSNTFQANYEGGDGNDLTLTVVSN